MLLFMFGTWVGGYLHMFQPAVLLIIENQSGQPIESLMVTYESLGIKGTLSANKIQPSKRIRFVFYIPHDGGYSVTARLANGKVVKDGSYIEPGYTEKIRVGSDRISTESSSFRHYLPYRYP